MMRDAAGFHRDASRWRVIESLHEGRASQPPSFDELPLRIGESQLEDVLGQIDSHRGNPR